MLEDNPILYYVAYVAPCGKPAPAFDEEPSVLSNPDAGSEFLADHCNLLGVSDNETPLRRRLDSSGTSRIDFEFTSEYYYGPTPGVDYSLLVRGYDSEEGAGAQEDDHISQAFVPYATFVERYKPLRGDSDGVEVEVFKFKFDCSIQYAHPGNDGFAH